MQLEEHHQEKVRLCMGRQHLAEVTFAVLRRERVLDLGPEPGSNPSSDTSWLAQASFWVSFKMGTKTPTIPPVTWTCGEKQHQ